MKSIAKTCAVIVLSATLVSAVDPNATTTDGSKGLRILEMVRGMWHGFNRGFYKKSSASVMNALCLDDNTASNFDNVYRNFNGLPA